MSSAAALWTAAAASLVVSLTSFGGILLLRLHSKATTTAPSSLVDYMATFAAGCLLGVVVFHLLPESFEKINNVGGTEHADDDAPPEWLAGAFVMLGVAVSLLIEVQVHVWPGQGNAQNHHHHHHGQGGRLKVLDHSADRLALPTETPTATSSLGSSSVSSSSHMQSSPFSIDTCDETDTSDEMADLSHDHSVTIGDHTPAHSEATTAMSPPTIAPIAWMTAVGDLCHAFTDGVVLAVAFQSCSRSLGWAVTLGIVLHEVPHRIGDFFIFLKAGMSAQQATVLNVLASCGSLLGVGVIASLGQVDETTLGAMLAVGAGSLLFIALAELLPPVLAVHDQRSAMGHVCWFVTGCGMMWLSALGEVECETTT